MECNKDEAIRAKTIAENKMTNEDFEGARKIALKAKKLFPELDNISQLLAVCDVHCSAQNKIDGTEKDLYGILQVDSKADESTIKTQYRKLALVLHPDKNHFPGAEAAFKLIGDAKRILSDKGTRQLYDLKCRAKPTVPKPQTHQANQTSHAGMQFGKTHFNSVNLNQQFQSSSNGKPSFWTCCPYCKIKYEYYNDVVNKRVTCSKCLRVFTAIDIGVHVQQSAQPGNAKVDPQRAGSSFPYFANQQPSQCNKPGDAKVRSSRGKTAESGNLNTEGGKKGVASKETVGNTTGVSDSKGKNSRKRPQVSNSEGADNGFSPEKKMKKKKSDDIKDKQKKVPDPVEVKRDVSEPKASVNAEGSMPKNNIKEKGKVEKEEEILNVDSDSNSDSEEEEVVYINCPEPEFSNFDRDKEEHCFAADQMWAIYDTSDGMPRFYAQIRKVYSPGFKVRISWLEADPENRQEKVWAEEGLPVACGRFKRGSTEENKDRLMFSHQITYEKGGKRLSFEVYPKEGEIWALFRDWDIKWSSDPESHLKFKYEIVEVLSDFDKEKGVHVAYMVKVEGFVCTFQKTSRARLAEHLIPSSELFRFSHRIPARKLTGKEKRKVPAGSYELDTAALPDDLHDLNVNPKNTSKTDACFPRFPERKVNDSDKEMPNVRRSPRGLKCNLDNSNGNENNSNNPTSSKGNDPSDQADAVNISSNGFTKDSNLSSPSGANEAISIHDFSLDKQNWKFQEGQIWALNLGCYAQIRKIESSPLILHVELLELCSDAIRPNACGLYRPSKVGRQIFQQDSFLYLVKAEVNGKNRFNIYPREKEIWVLNNKEDTNCTLSDVDAGDHDIVEVLENNGDLIRVLSLSRVPGYKSLFRALEMQNSKEKKVLEIAIADSHRFFCRVPAFLFTDEQDSCLKGSWELDLTEFPGLLLT